MQASVRRHIRSNVVGYVAVFLALTGTAAALPGTNTVDSKDIVNTEVKTADIGTGQVRSPDVANDTTPFALTGTDVANESLSGTDISDGSVGSADVGSLNGSDLADGTVGGADVNETSLGQVPSALLGGFGRSFGGGNCNPGSTTFIDCGFLTLNLPSQSRVLLVGRVTTLFSNGGFGRCRLVTSLGVLPNTDVRVQDAEAVPLTAVTGVIGPGSVDFGVECNQASGVIGVYEIGLSAVAIAPN